MSSLAGIESSFGADEFRGNISGDVGVEKKYWGVVRVSDSSRVQSSLGSVLHVSKEERGADDHCHCSPRSTLHALATRTHNDSRLRQAKIAPCAQM
jgi:hypothetical protein